MGVSFSKRHNRGSLAEINITPMVDVMLVLLIIFMVTAPMLQQGLAVNLPQASTPAIKRTNKDVVLSIKQDGKVYVGDDDEAVAMESLQDHIKQLLELSPEKAVYIKADATLEYGSVIKVMALAKQAGAERIGMLTQPERGS